MKSKLILDRSYRISENEILDVYYLEVERDSFYPEGMKYAINYRIFRNGKWHVIVRIDNKERQGHHIHFKGNVEKFNFTSFEDAKNKVLKLGDELK
ncbi:hypothetical protein HY989_03725 [Candidatus Micrarchaeota archaeon]|nr:hypothetical protein [Candidatus Micrarchaeota archaeon]